MLRKYVGVPKYRSWPLRLLTSEWRAGFGKSWNRSSPNSMFSISETVIVAISLFQAQAMIEDQCKCVLANSFNLLPHKCLYQFYISLIAVSFQVYIWFILVFFQDLYQVHTRLIPAVSSGSKNSICWIRTSNFNYGTYLTSRCWIQIISEPEPEPWTGTNSMPYSFF